MPFNLRIYFGIISYIVGACFQSLVLVLVQPEPVQRCVTMSSASCHSLRTSFWLRCSSNKMVHPQYLERGAPFENNLVQVLGCWSEYSSIDPGALFLPAGREGGGEGNSSLGSTQSGLAACLHIAGCDATRSVCLSHPPPPLRVSIPLRVPRSVD